MKATAPISSALDLRDLGTLVTVQYPDRPDLALIAALRLLSRAGTSHGIQVGYARGALLPRRTRVRLRGQSIPHTHADGELLLVGADTPAILILGPDCLLDLNSTYRLGELDLPTRLLCGQHAPSPSSPDHTLVDFPFGLTGVYLIHQLDSPLAAAYRLMSRLGPLTRRRLEFDLQQLEASWRQLRDTA